MMSTDTPLAANIGAGQHTCVPESPEIGAKYALVLWRFEERSCTAGQRDELACPSVRPGLRTPIEQSSGCEHTDPCHPQRPAM